MTDSTARQEIEGSAASTEDPAAPGWRWIAVALFAHTGWGIYPVLGRYMQTVSGLPTLSVLVVGGTPMLSILLFYILPRNGFRVFRSPALWLMGLVVVVRSITNLLSARFTLAIYVQLINLMTPFVVVVLSLLILRQRVPRHTGRAISFSFVGALLMMSADIGRSGLQFDLTPSDWLGLALALTSSFALAIYMIVVRSTADQGLPAEVVLVFQSVIIMTAALPISLVSGEDWGQWTRLGPTDWFVVGAYIVLVIFGANGLQITALRKLGAPLVSSMMAWRLMCALALGSLLLGERLTSPWQAVGALVVLTTITWYLWQQRTPTS